MTSKRSSAEPPRRWTAAHVRHMLTALRQGRNPVARVYDSIGADFFLAPAPGWLNLGLWERPGEPAEEACVRLVERVASALPRGGRVLDVGNGLATQDPVIARVTAASGIVAMNITESQLRAGRAKLAEAGAAPVVADAMRIPLASGSVDGVISVEAAFHFRSRRRFFAEARRVLRPGGVLAISDIPIVRMPRTPGELLAGLSMLRVFGMRSSAAATTEQIAGWARDAGFAEVRTDLVGERVYPPVLRLLRARLEREGGVPAGQRLAARFLLRQSELLWERRVIDYLLLTARL